MLRLEVEYRSNGLAYVTVFHGETVAGAFSGPHEAIRLIEDTWPKPEGLSSPESHSWLDRLRGVLS